MRRLFVLQARDTIAFQHSFETPFESHVFTAQGIEFPLLTENDLVEIVNVMLQQRQ